MKCWVLRWNAEIEGWGTFLFDASSTWMGFFFQYGYCRIFTMCKIAPLISQNDLNRLTNVQGVKSKKKKWWKSNCSQGHPAACTWCPQWTHLSVFKLHIQEVKVSEDPELLLRGGVVHRVGFSSSVFGWNQARLVLHQLQLAAARENHLYKKKKS